MKNRDYNPTRAESVAERPYSPTLNRLYEKTIRPVGSAVREEIDRFNDPSVRTKFRDIVGTAIATFVTLGMGSIWR